MIEDIVLLKERVAFPVISNLGLNSRINPHFGKAKGFVVVDFDGGNLEYHDAGQLREPSECAPVSGLVKCGAKAVLCRGMGRGALARCHSAGLKIGQSVGRTVEEGLENLNLGRSIDFPDSSLCDHGDSRCEGEEHAH